MIISISGKLVGISEDAATIEVAPFHYQVLLPDYTRRQLQQQIGKAVQLNTLHYFEGNPAQGGRMMPRLVGFLTDVEREFFDLFCSVDGVGVKKALRAMVRPVRELAVLIEQQDAKALSALPGIGPATAERIIAKLRRKMPRFALLKGRDHVPAPGDTPDSIVEETYQALLALQHSETEARQLIEEGLASGKKFKDTEALLTAIYQRGK